MKKTVLTLIAAIVVLPSFAQLGADGYYRIQNVGSGRYLSIANNKVDKTNKNALMSGNQGNIYSLATYSNVDSDPGSIIYIKKNSSSYDLISQGMNTANLLPSGASLAFENGNISGAYNLAGKYSGFKLYLTDVGSGSEGNCKTGKKNENIGNWYIKPIDQTNEYFCITPDLTVGNKYYTTVYAGFPFQLGAGMKAYYVSNNNGKYAQIDEIEDGIIPAGTPVIIECESNNPEDNKVTLLASTNAKISNNQLIGLYFNYVRKNADGTKINTTDIGKQLMENTIAFSASSMKVLGDVEGKLGFVDAPEDYLQFGIYLPANKAYLPLDFAAEDKLLLLDKESYEQAIKIITDDQATFEKDEENKSVSVVSGDNVTTNYEIPETITEYDGTEYTVTEIASDAFKDNETLTQIIIPGTVTTIGEGAFSGCKSLKEIIMKGENPPVFSEAEARTRADGSSVFEGVDLETCILYVPEGSLEKYQNAEGWCNFKNIKTFTAGINDIRMDEKTSDIYNLHGHKIQRKTSSVDQLPQGVYIMNGKKIIKK